MNSFIRKGRKIIKPRKRQSTKAREGKYIKELSPSNKPMLKMIPEAIAALYSLKSLIKHQKITVVATSGADR
jgi:hypothetical protein